MLPRADPGQGRVLYASQAGQYSIGLQRPLHVATVAEAGTLTLTVRAGLVGMGAGAEARLTVCQCARLASARAVISAYRPEQTGPTPSRMLLGVVSSSPHSRQGTAARNVTGASGIAWPSSVEGVRQSLASYVSCIGSYSPVRMESAQRSARAWVPRSVPVMARQACVPGAFHIRTGYALTVAYCQAADLLEVISRAVGLDSRVIVTGSPAWNAARAWARVRFILVTSPPERSGTRCARNGGRCPWRASSPGRTRRCERGPNRASCPYTKRIPRTSKLHCYRTSSSLLLPFVGNLVTGNPRQHGTAMRV
jgi:hypothetical protein